MRAKSRCQRHLPTAFGVTRDNCLNPAKPKYFRYFNRLDSVISAERQLNEHLRLHTAAKAHRPRIIHLHRIRAVFRLFARKNLQIVLGLAVALGIAATRTEKVLVEVQTRLPHHAGIVLSAIDHALPEPFDPARVPPSGGMASRLLAGVSVKLV
jgi:hypothetical protein